MIRLLLIYPSDPRGSKVGGAETFLRSLIKHAPDDFVIELIGISSDKVKRPPGKWTQLHIGNKSFNFYPLFFVKDENKKSLIPLALRFTIALGVSKIDFSKRIIFFNRIEPALACKNVRSPKIAIVHNDIQKQIYKKGSEVAWSKYPFLYTIIEKSIFKSLAYIYTVSNNSLQLYKDRYSNLLDKISFIPTCFDDDVFSVSVGSQIETRRILVKSFNNLPLEKKWILFVGRLQEQKAPLRLIQVFSEYCKSNDDACLLIIGEGDLTKSVQEVISKRGLEDKIYLLGSFNQSELVNFYRGSDVLLITSNFEGMPIAVLEGLHCGIPVVSTDVGEIKSIVTNDFSGEVVSSFEPRVIAEALEKVLKNKQKYSQANCIASVANYTPQKVLCGLYDKIRIMSDKLEALNGKN